jgi:hypothetical protein
MHVFHRDDVGILRGRSASDSNQRLSGGIGDQVQMKVAGRGRHWIDGITCRSLGRRPRLLVLGKDIGRQAGETVHTRAAPRRNSVSQSSIGEMWIAAEQDRQYFRKSPHRCPLSVESPSPHPPVGICESTVDDMWVRMYESNQPSSHYNRFYKNDSV